MAAAWLCCPAHWQRRQAGGWKREGPARPALRVPVRGLDPVLRACVPRALCASALSCFDFSRCSVGRSRSRGLGSLPLTHTSNASDIASATHATKYGSSSIHQPALIRSQLLTQSKRLRWLSAVMLRWRARAPTASPCLPVVSAALRTWRLQFRWWTSLEISSPVTSPFAADLMDHCETRRHTWPPRPRGR